MDKFQNKYLEIKNINKDIVEKLNEGKITFKEEGLEELFKDAVERGIQFSSEYENTDAYIITVPTPYI